MASAREMPSDTRSVIKATGTEASSMNTTAVSQRSRHVCAMLLLAGTFLAGVQDCTAQGSSVDARTLREFHQTLIANTRAAEIARNRAWSRTVRRVADNAAHELRQTRFNIESVARRNRISLTNSMSASGRSLINRISTASGSSFDRIYLDNTTIQMRW